MPETAVELENGHVEGSYVTEIAVELEKRSRRRELRARNGG
ncbi:hypothetical protein [Neobacillus rhizophilus]|nr:hypothetical protein [Neobacillus rhizophilus]